MEACQHAGLMSSPSDMEEWSRDVPHAGGHKPLPRVNLRLMAPSCERALGLRQVCTMGSPPRAPSRPPTRVDFSGRGLQGRGWLAGDVCRSRNPLNKLTQPALSLSHVHTYAGPAPWAARGFWSGYVDLRSETSSQLARTSNPSSGRAPVLWICMAPELVPRLTLPRRA